MKTIYSLYGRIDTLITEWMARHGIKLLRLSLGVIFLWFGALKFFPDVSSAEELATRTIETLSFGLVQPDVSRPVLAAWETLIGIGLIAGIYMRATLFLLFAHMLGTVTPIFLFPQDVFVTIPLVPTLEGQYIIKNLVVISGGIIVGATVRGGRVIADPDKADIAETIEKEEPRSADG